MGKTLLLTGASSDIGINFIETACRNYSKIIAHYHTPSVPLERLREKFPDQLLLEQADFQTPDRINEFVQKLSEQNLCPDCILHLPAVKVKNQRFHKLQWGDFQKNMDVQLRSCVVLLQHCLPSMCKKKYGRIVFLLTSYTEGIPPKYLSDYIAVKYAMLGLMRALSAEYAGRGIVVNGISPGMMETKFLSDLPELVIQKSAAQNPIGRNTEISDILPVLSYLLSEQAEFITGQNIVISGGV